MTDNDTIAAIATPPGTGGVGIVRVSGPQASDIALAILGRAPQPRRATHANFNSPDGEPVDSGLAIYFPAPRSFTGEDVLELHGHGGRVVQQLILDAVLAAGARLAEPGEFSRRAFDNGKLDLAQAEAVADLISSGSRRAARTALRSLSGEFSARVEALADALTGVRVYVEAAIDFPDEDIDFLSDDALAGRLAHCRAAFEELLKKSEAGRVLRDGFRVVIAGPPNAGKSSLMNALSGDETAIVTDIAGTTRDILRETIVIDGLLVELIDTAGLRDNAETIEREGIRRARQAMAAADALLWVVDSTVADKAPMDVPEDIPAIVVCNKIDRSEQPAGQRADGRLGLSATSGRGLDALKSAITALAGLEADVDGAFSARQRHVDALRRAAEHFERGVAALEQARAGELLAEELRLAQDELGSITGRLHSDELLGRIFADFCIGK